jgi:excisionase family DNA binding protein
VNSAELLTVSQLAQKLHVQPRTIQAWARAGRIPCVKLSAKVVRFEWEAVLTALHNQANRGEVVPCRE